MALGLGVIALIILGAVLRSALAVVAAYALTTIVTMPGILDAITWLAAGGYVVLNVVVAFVALAAIFTASKTQRRFR